MKVSKITFTSASYNRILQDWSALDKGYIILSGSFTPSKEELADMSYLEKNELRRLNNISNKEMKKQLKDTGVGFIETTGIWKGNFEPSYFVPFVSKDEAKDSEYAKYLEFLGIDIGGLYWKNWDVFFRVMFLMAFHSKASGIIVQDAIIVKYPDDSNPAMVYPSEDVKNEVFSEDYIIKEYEESEDVTGTALKGAVPLNPDRRNLPKYQNRLDRNSRIWKMLLKEDVSDQDESVVVEESNFIQYYKPRQRHKLTESERLRTRKKYMGR